MRLLGTLVAAAALALGGLVASPALGPASAAACSGTSGVTVVIGSSVRCAPGDPASGWAALAAVAEVVPVQRQPGFVCRIDGAPTPAEDACQVTPPTSAYWSYWHAQPGGSWQYSNVGAASYNPAPGSVEGWAFGAGSPPPMAPPTGPAPTPSPAPSSPSGGGGTGAGGGSGGTTTPSSGSGGTTVKPGTRGDAGRTATAPAGTSAAPTTTAPTSAVPTTAPTSTAPTSAGAGTAATTAEDQPTVSAVRRGDDPAGPSLSPLLGGGLVLALGAAAGGVAWRRRANG